MQDLKFVITCCKQDYWFAKLCVSSIRYFYPKSEIYLIKERLLGEFSTKEIEKYFDVKILSYDDNKFGISASKIFFYTDQKDDDSYYVVLDCDIILLGKLNIPTNNEDVIISPEYDDNPLRNKYFDLYFDVRNLKDPNYNYPGYFFNAGQLICKKGFLRDKKDLITRYFDFTKFPRWIRLDLLPKHDQSLINYIFPKFEAEGNLKIGMDEFMVWTGWEEAENLDFKFIIANGLPKVLHYAGEFRDPNINKMKRSDLLIFFKKAYYNKLPFGKLRYQFSNFYNTTKFYVFEILKK